MDYCNRADEVVWKCSWGGEGQFQRERGEGGKLKGEHIGASLLLAFATDRYTVSSESLHRYIENRTIQLTS